MNLIKFKEATKYLHKTVQQSFLYAISKIKKKKKKTTKEDRMQIFEGILFFKVTNTTKTKKSLICCQLGSCRRKSAPQLTADKWFVFVFVFVLYLA